MSTTGELPESLTDIGHTHVSRGLDAFLGYEAIGNNNARISTFKDGNIVTLDGSTGPWLARQVMGPYSGRIVEYWGNDNVHDAVELLSQEFGWVPCRTRRDLGHGQIHDGDAVDVLFGDVTPKVLGPEMELRPIIKNE